jgi:hypothetical protein
VLDQYLAMDLAQLTYRESLRDIETCLGAVGSKLYHMGFRSSVATTKYLYTRTSRIFRICVPNKRNYLCLPGSPAHVQPRVFTC